MRAKIGLFGWPPSSQGVTAIQLGTTSYALEYVSVVWRDKNNNVLMSSKSSKIWFDYGLLELNWMNLSTRREIQRCIVMYNVINDSNQNTWLSKVEFFVVTLLVQRTLFEVQNPATNWELLGSLNTGLLDWNSLPVQIKNLSFDASGKRWVVILDVRTKVFLFSWLFLIINFKQTRSSFNPLSPGVKLQILLLCYHTFLTEVVGRSC